MTAACDPGSAIDVDEHVSYVVARLEELELGAASAANPYGGGGAAGRRTTR